MYDVRLLFLSVYYTVSISDGDKRDKTNYNKNNVRSTNNVFDLFYRVYIYFMSEWLLFPCTRYSR